MLREAKKYTKQVILMSSGNVGTAAFYVKNGEPDKRGQEIKGDRDNKTPKSVS